MINLFVGNVVKIASLVIVTKGIVAVVNVAILRILWFLSMLRK